jgi:FKBP-type peptidyl-prolyl cis-trans isomerase
MLIAELSNDLLKHIMLLKSARQAEEKRKLEIAKEKEKREKEEAEDREKTERAKDLEERTQESSTFLHQEFSS